MFECDYLTSKWHNARKKSVRVEISSKKFDQTFKQIERGIYREVMRGNTNAKLSASVLHAKCLKLLEKG